MAFQRFFEPERTKSAAKLLLFTHIMSWVMTVFLSN